MDPGALRVRDDRLAGRWRLNVTPQARAISAVSAPASRIALARAILGSMMSGVSALMPERIGGEGGVGDRVSLVLSWSLSPVFEIRTLSSRFRDPRGLSY